MSYKNKRTTNEAKLVGILDVESVRNGHQLVDNDERDPQTSTKGENLLTNCITKGVGALWFVVQNFGHRSVGKDLTDATNNVDVHVANEVGGDS